MNKSRIIYLLSYVSLRLEETDARLEVLLDLLWRTNQS
jgi:hypothetical protein